MKINSLVALFFLLLVAIGFPFLLSTKLIAGGDYTSPLPFVIHATANFWSWCDYAGLGFNCAAINLHSTPMWFFALLLNFLHIPLFLIERILWWIPFFVGGYISILLFAKKLFPKNIFWFLTPFIYVFNTYILMVVGGGQIAGIALGYALIPLLFWSFIRMYEKFTSHRTVVVGLLLALLVVVDPRIAFIGYFGCVLYAIFSCVWFRRFSISEVRHLILVILLPAGIATLSHAYWILPALVVHQNPLVQLGPAYSTTGAASYFSFATLENAFGLLHPNWPENLFGKTSFMRPEFLLLPILAFSSVLFIGKKKVNENKEVFSIVFLLFLALLGIFLAKGAQDPLGGLYLWIFSHIPGFQLFRDPTKWYLFVFLSYALLIPYTLQKIGDFFMKK